MSPRELWQAALGELQLTVPRQTYETWLKQTHGVSIDDNSLLVAVPNEYAREWLEQRLEGTVCRAVQRIAGRPLACSFVVQRSSASHAPAAPLFDTAQPALTEAKSNGAGRGSPLNERYTFETFVVGSGNRMAHAASFAVGEATVSAYNPLFIHGGVGLGKTHLLHAVGNLAAVQGARVVCVSSETFANDLIHSIRSQSTEAFRSVYRASDVLLVDDIQFIAGKESTQEEFFHTFNAIHASQGKIVMTSDRPPAAIATLEERLKSRFHWGLIVDIEPPDFETRLAILSTKAEDHGYDIGVVVLELIANTVRTNVRELEGALHRVMAFARFSGEPVSIELARRAMEELLTRPKSPGLERIIEVVASHFGVSCDDLRGTSRAARYSEPRQIAMFLMRAESDASYPLIGNTLGGRDHTTVLHGCGKISRLIERDPKLRRAILDIRERLYAA
jgi:chromosomal replication initiator protein